MAYEKNNKMSTLDLVEEDLEGLNLQGKFKTVLIIHKQIHKPDNKRLGTRQVDN